MATLKDVAAYLNINVSTVSRALNGEKGVSPEMRSRILKAAAKLNYTPNLAARAMTGKGSNIIGLITPEINSSYFSHIICELEKKLSSFGYSLMVISTQFDPDREIRALRNFCQYNVDGIFSICPLYLDVINQFKPTLDKQGIPLILLEARLHTQDYNYILIDDEAGMILAIQHLLKIGHKRIGFLSDPALIPLRNQLFINAIKTCGLDPKENPIYQHETQRFEIAGYETMQQILNEQDYPHAFLAGYDDIAIGAMRAITEAGLRIPEDIAIIGNDDIREAPYLSTSLTTLAPPLTKMAHIGVEMMLNSIRSLDQDTIHHVRLKPELIIREST